MKSIKVPSITLDEICKKHGINADFLSLDTQGGERRIFAGATEQLLQNSIGVLTEVQFHEIYSGNPFFGDVHKIMMEKGFNFMKLFPRVNKVNFFRVWIA